MEERRLTPELREKLLGALPFSVSSTIWYSPDKYKEIEEDFRPSFELKSLTKEEFQRAKKLLKDVKSAKEEDINEIVRKKIVSWKNMFDAGTLEEIPFKEDESGGCDKKLFESIPPVIVGALFFQISKISCLIDTDKLGLSA
jgi:hypothetical protein